MNPFMKSKSIVFKIILLTITTHFCHSQQTKTTRLRENETLTVTVEEDGKIENNVYKCNLFDWEMQIPEGYSLRSQERTKELEEKGFSAMKENLPEGQRKIQSAKTLISFEDNNYNSFSATYEPIPKTRKMTLTEHQAFMAKLMQDTYNSAGVQVEVVKSSLKIGKREFYKIMIKLFHPKNNSVILTQELYTSYINDHVFLAAISYKNEQAGMVLNYNFLKSFK